MNLDRIIAVRNNKTIYRDGNSLVKVFENGYSKPEIYREAYLQTLMSSLGLNVPAIKQVNEYNGKTFIIYEYINGNSVSDILKRTPERCDEMAELLADLQYDISCKKASIRLLNECINDSLLKTQLEETDITELKKLLESFPRKDTLIHGELIPQNVIISRDGTPYIIDWEYASQGDICYAHAATCISMLADGNNQMVRHYLDTLYTRYSTASEEIVKWMPLASAVLSSGYFGNKRQFLLDHVKSTVSRYGGNL